MMLPIAPWLSSKYSPPPAAPETGPQHPQQDVCLPPQSWAAVIQPLSLPLLTAPAQNKAAGTPTFQFSFPHTFVFSSSQQGLGLTPSALVTVPLLLLLPDPNHILCLLSHLDQVV